MRFCMIAALPVTLLAGCTDGSRQAPVSTSCRGSGPGSSEPKRPNSLPSGASMDAPLTGCTGNVEDTRISQATLDAARAVLIAASGY